MPNTPKTQPTTLLQGAISHLRTRRGSADFLFNQTQKDNLTTAILADFVSGNEGIGASLSSMSDITVERADYLTFVLDGKSVEACVWASNFRDGDEVSVVAEQVDESWKGFAIYRPEDGLVAVYPHCTRGRFAHIKATGRWILVIGSVTYAIVIGLIYVTSEDANDFIEFAKLGVPVIFATTALFAIRGAWKFKKIVRMAERIFTTFGWPHPKSVDLRSGVKRKKREGDPPSFGVSLFRYDSNR